MLTWYVTAEHFCTTVKIVITGGNSKNQLVQPTILCPAKIKGQWYPKSHLVAEIGLEPRSLGGQSIYPIKAKVRDLLIMYSDAK